MSCVNCVVQNREKVEEVCAKWGLDLNLLISQACAAAEQSQGWGDVCRTFQFYIKETEIEGLGADILFIEHCGDCYEASYYSDELDHHL